MKVPTLKLPKGVTQEFVDGIQSMSTDELKALIVTLQVQNQDNEGFKASENYVKESELYASARDRFNLVAGPVKDTAVSLKNRTKMVIERLKEKGGA